MILRAINFHQKKIFFSFVSSSRCCDSLYSSSRQLYARLSLYLVHRNEFNGASEINSSKVNLHSLLLLKKCKAEKWNMKICWAKSVCGVERGNLNSNLLHLAWKCVMLSFHFEYIRKLLKCSKCLNLINIRSILFRMFLPTFLLKYNENYLIFNRSKLQYCARQGINSMQIKMPCDIIPIRHLFYQLTLAQSIEHEL